MQVSSSQSITLICGQRTTASSRVAVGELCPSDRELAATRRRSGDRRGCAGRRGPAVDRRRVADPVTVPATVQHAFLGPFSVVYSRTRPPGRVMLGALALALLAMA